MLPDPKLTPGKLAVSQKDRRGVTDEMEHRVMLEYSIPWTRRYEFKIDHLIPKELGGADDVANLWPQSLFAKPYNPRRKELLAERFVQMIAAGRITLAAAQNAMREDWISAYVEYVGMVYLTPGAAAAKPAAR
jgi:hypothetical protein